MDVNDANYDEFSGYRENLFILAPYAEDDKETDAICIKCKQSTKKNYKNVFK